MKNNYGIMNNQEVIELLAKCTNIPKASFGTNIVEPYKELQFIMNKVCIICQKLVIIKEFDESLKKYRDDTDTVENIKEYKKYIQQEISEFCTELDEYYTQKAKEGWI